MYSKYISYYSGEYCHQDFFSGSSEKELYETLDTFWSEYKKFNHNNDPFDSNEFIWSSKDIFDINSHLWHHKYYTPSTKFIGVVDSRVTSKIIGIVSEEPSWVDVKTIKSVKRSALGIDTS